MAITAEQIKTPEQIESSLRNGRFHDHIRVFSEPIYPTVNYPETTPQSAVDSVLIAFDAHRNPELKSRDFADEIERTLGFRATTDQSEVIVPLILVDGNEMADPSSRASGDLLFGRYPGQISGYYGIRLTRSDKEGIDAEEVALIAAMIAERYEGDETLRALYDYTTEEPVNPIEITGPGYNLAQSTTAEHPAIEIEDLVKEHPEVRWERVAPDLTRVAFA